MSVACSTEYTVDLALSVRRGVLVPYNGYVVLLLSAVRYNSQLVAILFRYRELVEEARAVDYRY